MATIEITRRSGPCIDKAARIDVSCEEMELVNSVLKAVNLVTNNKEGWYCWEVEEEQPRTCYPLPSGTSSKCIVHRYSDKPRPSPAKQGVNECTDT